MQLLTKKSLSTVFISFLISIFLAGYVSAGTYKLGHAGPSTHPYQAGALKFAELVKEATHGKIIIDVFPASQLGNERDLIEGLQLGTVDFTITTTGTISSFQPEFGVTDLPFLFRDLDHAYKVLDGDVGDELYKKIEGIGIKGLSWFENGFRHVSNSKRPINSVDDIKGLKIRTMENPIHVAFFRQLGADPTPMAWGEVFSALEQGVVDGQENPVAVLTSAKLYEVQKYYALTGHVYSAVPLMVRLDLFNSFSKEEQTAIMNAALEASKYERKLLAEQEVNGLVELKAKGMLISEPDRSKFQAAVQPVYEKFSKSIGKDLINQVIETK